MPIDSSRGQRTSCGVDTASDHLNGRLCCIDSNDDSRQAALASSIATPKVARAVSACSEGDGRINVDHYVY